MYVLMLVLMIVCNFIPESPWWCWSHSWNSGPGIECIWVSCSEVCAWWLAFEAAYSCLDEWDELLVRMLEACKEESDDRKVILQFIQCCLTFIDKCIYYGIFDSLKLGATQHRTVWTPSSLHPKNVNIIVLCCLECRTIKLIVLLY